MVSYINCDISQNLQASQIIKADERPFFKFTEFIVLQVSTKELLYCYIVT